MGTETETEMDTAGLASVSRSWSPNNSSVSQLPTPSLALGNLDVSLIGDNCQPSPWLPFQLDLDPESSPSEVLDSESFISSIKSQPITNQKKILSCQFRGPSNPTSIVTSVQELCNFMKQAVEDHHILGAPQWATYRPNREQPLPFYSSDGVEQVMKRLLPTKERCRHLTKSYFDHFTGIRAPFHVPSFWHEYHSYWDNTHTDSVRFNAVLLAIISCSRCLFVDDPLSFDGDSSTARKEAAQWLHAVEEWKGYREAKSTTIEAFQIRCVVLLSKTLNDIDRENHYTDSQTLLADAISNGIHRDWKQLGVNESVYERQLRCKVWSTVTELDIAACMERGVPSMVSNLYADIEDPKGYNDGDYNSTTTFEPIDQPDDQLTDGSFAKIASKIRPLRYEVNDLVNNPQKHKSFSQDQLIGLRVRISNALDDIPKWLDPVLGLAGHNQGLVYRAVLELYLHELLVLLHLPFAISRDTPTNFPAVDTDFQRFICARSASTIIKIHELLMSEGFSPAALGKANLLRAGLCLCLLEGGSLNYGKFLLGQIIVNTNTKTEQASLLYRYVQPPRSSWSNLP
jgi:hypothetical protein